MGYTKKTISGFSWQTILKALTTTLVLIKIMVLARLLSPQDFGLFSLVAITLGLAESTTQTGVNLTILQSKKSIKYFINTAWVISIARGFIIGIIMTIMGVLMSKYYHEPRLSLLIALTSLIPIIKGFINPSIISFYKNLKFFQDSLYRLSLLVIETIFAIIFAVIFKDVVALILAMLIAGLFEVFISFILFKEKPKFEYISSRAEVIFANTKGLSLSATLSYLNENIDDFLLGKIIGTHDLGLYHNAYALGHKANYEFAKSINHSTLPVFSKIANETTRLKKAFLKSMLVTILITLSISLPLLLFPNFIVKLVLGSQWLAIAPNLHLFIIAGLLQSITIIFYTLFYAKKNYKALNFHLFLTVTILVVTIKILAPTLGIVGGALALIISRSVTIPVLFYSTYKIFSIHNEKTN